MVATDITHTTIKKVEQTISKISCKYCGCEAERIMDDGVQLCNDSECWLSYIQEHTDEYFDGDNDE